MSKFRQISIAITLILSLTISSCNNNSGVKYTDTPTSGKIKICVDETFQPILKSEIDVFTKTYPNAVINPIYVPETEIFNRLITDSVNIIIASRKLTENEIKYFNSKKLFPKETKIASDALALLVNNDNPDTLITIETIKNILIGKITKWTEIDPKSKLNNIKVVFDNPNSSTVRYISDSICRKEKISEANLSAMNYNKDVVDFISKTPNAIGIIGVNWVSDRDDSTAMTFLKKVKVMAVSREKIATEENSFQPYQAYIRSREYPFVRELYAISAEPRVGLGTGFISFVAGDKGQRIFLKSGLVPETQPVRMVHINKNL